MQDIYDQIMDELRTERIAGDNVAYMIDKADAVTDLYRNIQDMVASLPEMQREPITWLKIHEAIYNVFDSKIREIYGEGETEMGGDNN